jgi:hypothetical protein
LRAEVYRRQNKIKTFLFPLKTFLLDDTASRGGALRLVMVENSKSAEGRLSPTIKTLAAHTGYSIATISKALRGSPVVTESTRDTILTAARELGYRRMPAAWRCAPAGPIRPRC